MKKELKSQKILLGVNLLVFEVKIYLSDEDQEGKSGWKGSNKFGSCIKQTIFTSYTLVCENNCVRSFIVWASLSCNYVIHTCAYGLVWSWFQLFWLVSENILKVLFPRDGIGYRILCFINIILLDGFHIIFGYTVWSKWFSNKICLIV